MTFNPMLKGTLFQLKHRATFAVELQCHPTFVKANKTSLNVQLQKRPDLYTVPNAF
jgi:hypothetical protein